MMSLSVCVHTFFSGRARDRQRLYTELNDAK